MNAATNYLFPCTIGIISICYLTTGYYQIGIASTISIVVTILAAIYLITRRSNQFLSNISTTTFERTLSASAGANIFRVFFPSNSTQPIGNQDQKAQQKQKTRRKIGPKHIIQELISIWGTTYTVITWGSFYLIGGTIVASERLAQKVKSKYNREQSGLHDESFSRGTGWSETFTSFASSSSAARESASSASNNQRDTFRRISSWTKRSYTTSKKKLIKLFTHTNTTPQITGASNTSGS